jgi:alanyl-tRNA synthetase
MKSQKIREKFLQFFKERGHKILPPAPLVQEGDPSVLFTTAGVQQFRGYFLDPHSAPSKKIVTSQPCFRTSDIEEVGNGKNLTFFEMLGNFSFGSYFKEEAIRLAFQFLTEELQIPKEKLKVTVLPTDKESFKIWQKIIPSSKIIFGNKEDNFWGPIGEEGPCGPCTEIIYNDLELWNLVFNEYYQEKNGKLKPLKSKGVDTGMGLERLAKILQNVPTVYETDLYQPIIKKIFEISGVQQNDYERDENVRRYIRIIADHIRGIVFLAAEGIVPSNKLHGYVLRRIIRRSMTFAYLLGIRGKFLNKLVQGAIETLGPEYPNLINSSKTIFEIVEKEEDNFERTLRRGLKELEKLKTKKTISGESAFKLYDTFGFPLELTKEITASWGKKVDERGFKKEMEKQKKRTRKAQKILKVASPNPKLHTACHLLHQALRDILGKHVKQAGQDITGDELRFDFTHPQKLTEEEIQKIEKTVNQKIKENLPVVATETTVAEAKKKGAMALFTHKYGKRVTLYSIGDYSKELCAGPHVKSTGELKHFKIISEKSSASGIRRIKARLRPWASADKARVG